MEWHGAQEEEKEKENSMIESIAGKSLFNSRIWASQRHDHEMTNSWKIKLKDIESDHFSTSR
jgi:hypothetical protein